MRTLTVPELSLVVLVGTTGSGKSTFAARHFAPTQVLSSDYCRGLVSDDENDQSASADAFALLHHIAGIRLRRGLLTVVDATNVQPKARAALVEVARSQDVLPVAVVLDVPEEVCRARNEVRPDRAMGPHVIARQRREMRANLRNLEREGFRKVHILRGVEEIDDAVFAFEKAYNDKRELAGPFDVIGDVHGCRSELETLLTELGYRLVPDAEGRPVDAVPPESRTAVFVGDLVDRGPDTPGVLRLVMGMVEAGHALCVPGNHESKLVKALTGRKVQHRHGLAESLEQLSAESEEFRARVVEFCRGLVSHYVLDGGRLVVAHAGLKEAYQGRASGRVRSFAMYGETTGETDEYGLPVRYPWAEEYRGSAMVLYGHTPTVEPEWVNNTLCLDTGCVFGGELTALRYPERAIVAVPAERVWYEPAKPLGPARAVRDPGVLDLGDVLGRRVVGTRLMGNLSVREENAAAALEVMSRFAVDPRWLVYLPPTMAPVATSARPGLLEAPAEAFGYFSAAGVARVVCEEKHMGSRAVVLVTRDAAGSVAAKRFGVEDGSTGIVVTRTGRPFFDASETTEALLARVRAAVDAAGLWDELGTDWLLLDCELLPWSAKAMGLLRDQYAAVGAAARAGLGATIGVLERAAARGLDVGELLEAQGGRRAAAEAFTAAYGRYCWPTSGLEGVRLAPFQVLAGEGSVYAVRDHGWHLDVLDRLCAADPGFFRATGRRIVDLADGSSVAAASAWWEELTGAGGEGMVVKPFEALVREGRRIVQPGVKCRGPEYLRIIYGPEYLEERNRERLRRRSLGRKQSLALREYALGLEALERFTAGEPLYRVHEAVFAVLALESEPVDPRL
ncbi:polynucleotide kinase-phosphatase [Actinospica sp. MGRD01-02]|uniref:Polynucleotide kinase-phosphatase n=1 Tax=Actinospica acidithermotolerans TaxID=2828514 RepID=A0A941IL55_9ACTN|nr:polynucleotide kinase-phosphatase [Actinospica acidithermotolerans]MBR7831359.1 polynucleotide kinase-phosphatase [Actinospica acidithermotolerans]